MDESEIIERIFPRDSVLPPAPQINPARDPIRLAGMTVKAVAQVGEAAATEIEDAAKTIEQAAEEIGNKLRRLADAVREESKIAGGHVSEFCGKATSVIDGVREMQQRLEAGNGNGHV